jgi:hypothetical protein
MPGALGSKSSCCSFARRTEDYPVTRRRAMRRVRVVPCVPVVGLRAVVVLCREEGEQAVTAHTPAPRSSPCLPSFAGAR